MSIKFAIPRRVRRFAGNDRGNVAILFALSCLVIFPLVGFAIDLSRVMVEKQKLQQATDAAALAAAHDPFLTSGQREGVINAHLDHLEEVLGREITYELTQDAEGRISLVTHITVNTTIAKILGRDYVAVTVRSDAVQGGADIEVAMILDITGSMAGTRITALKEASADLVNIVVKDEQTPYYTKVSMVPYAVAVNVGDYAEQVRGPITGGRPVTGAYWQVGAQKSLTQITNQNIAVVTSNSHGFANGDRVWISGVSGMTQVNDRVFTIFSVTTDNFRLQSTDSRSYGTYTSGGIIRKCANTNCEVTVTANGHGLDNGDHVWITGVNGMTQINRTTHQTWVVSNTAANTYVLNSTVGPSYGAYTNGGTSFCTEAGCQYFRFNNASNGAQRLHRITTCATERTGDEAYTDAAAAESYVGRGYLSTSNPCPAARIIPLTADKDLLLDAIDDLSIGGSTAGHMGAAWGFYTLSPEFGDIFPAASKPAAFGRPK
ncbi:MAG: ubiquitin-activating E1 FCCH domain-containing protein, partial [Hyphomonas sp.]|uniref:TadE/TadG family type IV pilus assembly protein n=1 Tax=Hyphomonas sp. TaxID=87 RepID=UPI00349FE77A